MELTKKGMDWQWGPYKRKAFQTLKDALCFGPILLFLNPKLSYIPIMDGRGIAVGGVLIQDQGAGFQPLAFLN